MIYNDRVATTTLVPQIITSRGKPANMTLKSKTKFVRGISVPHLSIEYELLRTICKSFGPSCENEVDLRIGSTKPSAMHDDDFKKWRTYVCTQSRLPNS